MKNDNKPTLNKIKTGKWQRRWSLTKTGVTASSKASFQLLGSALLSADKREQRRSEILSEQSQYLADELGKLKGSVVKVGQMMALYGEHILPVEVSQALRSLEEQTTPLSWQYMQPVLKKLLGKNYSDFTIDPKPIGCASLAQVYKATHCDIEQPLCLKVQYPGIKEAIDSDIDAVVQLLRVSTLWTIKKNDRQFDHWLEEIRRLLHQEVDYVLEAETTAHFYQLLSDDDTFNVPKVYSQYSNSELLVMSFEEGVAVNDVSLKDLSQEHRNDLAKAFLKLFFDEVFVWQFMQTDPNFGNYRVLFDDNKASISLLDFGAVSAFNDDFIAPVKLMIRSAITCDRAGVIEGGIGLGLMQSHFPEDVLEDFVQLCYLLVEPFTYQQNIAADAEQCPDYITSEGEYCWSKSYLPRRAAKHAAKSALSKYFAVPPKEFTLLSRKLLGVYSFIAALDAQFDSSEIIADYI